jgi:hypothetical protein
LDSKLQDKYSILYMLMYEWTLFDVISGHHINHPGFRRRNFFKTEDV